MAKTKPTPKLKPITIKSIDEYLELEADRKELDRKSNLIKRKTDAMKANFANHVLANKSKPITKGRYRIAFQDRAGRVSWKDAFITVAGIDQAEALVAAVAPSRSIVIS